MCEFLHTPYIVWLVTEWSFRLIDFEQILVFLFSTDPDASLTLLIGSGSGYSLGNCSPRCRRTPAVLLLDLSGIRIRCELLVWTSRKQFQTMIFGEIFFHISKIVSNSLREYRNFSTQMITVEINFLQTTVTLSYIVESW